MLLLAEKDKLLAQLLHPHPEHLLQGAHPQSLQPLAPEHALLWEVQEVLRPPL